MDPSPEPPPQDNPPNETTHISAEFPPTIPTYMIAMRPDFPEPDPIRAVPKDYLPDRVGLERYVGQLKMGLQTLVQGPLDYRLVSFMNSWDGQNVGIEQTGFDAAARLVVAVLDAGPRSIIQNQTKTPLGADDWGSLASACLAAIARGFTRPLKETTHKTYIASWESLDDNPQRILEEGENPEFHSLLQRLKATSQHLDIHINADESDGLRKWTSVVRKGVEETAQRAAVAEAEMALHRWKADQLNTRQKQFEEDLNKIILERNIDLLRSTAELLGVTIGEQASTLRSRPMPTTGGKRTASGSTPLPAPPVNKAKSSSPLNVPVAPISQVPQAPQIDIITLTAAVQTAMQPFMARLEAAERRSTTTQPPAPPTPTGNAQAVKSRTRMAPETQIQTRQANQANENLRLPPVSGQQNLEGDWTQVTNKRNRNRTGKNVEQTNSPLKQINLTPRSYAETTGVAATTTSAQPHAQSQQLQGVNHAPTFTEITVIRHGGSVNTVSEQAVRKRRPDAIVREVQANMARAVARPLPITAGRWSTGARSKGNFVFRMQGQIDFKFIQPFESFLTGPFPGGGQLCPNQGWTKLLAHGVPIMDNDDRVFGPDDLQQEVRCMDGLRSVYFSATPRWIKPVANLNSNYTSLTFAFSDPDGSITKGLLANKQALFGKEVQIERWIDKPLLIQCGRCHALGHAASSKACRLPRDSVRCYICGKGHKAEAHSRECPRASQHRAAGTCNCRLQCLTCNKVGHHARDRTCPAREGYRSRKPRLNPKDKGKGKERYPPDLLEVTPIQHGNPSIPQRTGEQEFLEEPEDEIMLDREDNFGDNFAPQIFLPGPGLSKEGAFLMWVDSAEERLDALDIPIADQQVLSGEDSLNREREVQCRALLDSKKNPEETREAEKYELAEAVIIVIPGYFHPGMETMKQRQLAAILSTGTPTIVDQNTPGVASTSATPFLC